MELTPISDGSEKQVAALAEIDKYGLGNRFMGKVTIDVSGNYKYRTGEKPWIHYENKPEYSEQPVREHTWRVKYMSEEFLRNYFAKAMGSSTFTRADQKDFAKRQKCSHPEQYSIPQFILNHPMGQSRQSTFKDVWRFPGLIAKEYGKGTNPGEWNVNQLAERNGTKNANTVKLGALVKQSIDTGIRKINESEEGLVQLQLSKRTGNV